MKKTRINHGLHGLGSLTFAVIWMLVCGGSAVAATGTSSEFKIDLKGMGPWIIPEIQLVVIKHFIV